MTNVDNRPAKASEDSKSANADRKTFGAAESKAATEAHKSSTRGLVVRDGGGRSGSSVRGPHSFRRGSRTGLFVVRFQLSRHGRRVEPLRAAAAPPRFLRDAPARRSRKELRELPAGRRRSRPRQVFDNVGMAQIRAVDQSVGRPDLSAFGHRYSGAAQTDCVQSDNCSVSVGHEKGRHILDDLCQPAHDGQFADANELMNGGISGNDSLGADKDIASEDSATHDRDIVAENAVMSDVRVGHQQAAVSDHGR